LVDNDSVDKICERIREDGDAEIESIIEKAKQTADDIIARANSAGEAAAEKILKEAQEKGGIASKRLLSSVNLEVKRAKLKAREEVVQEINERVGAALKDYRASGDYGAVLTGLALEAIRSLDGDSFIVRAAPEDIGIVEKEVFPSLRAKLKEEGRDVTRLAAEPLDRPVSGGVQVGVPGGNVIYDNTFEARLYRLREEIRNIIFEDVFAEESKEEPGSA
jgi:V/A-type H+-transporting ATPase subunit E